MPCNPAATRCEIAKVVQKQEFRRISAPEATLQKDPMSGNFTETGQTFSDDGAAYCPVERRRRGPVAVAASITVMVLGAGFLAFSVTSSPVTTPESASTPQENVGIALSETAPTPEPDAAAAEAVDIEPAKTPAISPAQSLTVAEALAESRAARAAAQPASRSDEEHGFTPRLKPTLMKPTATITTAESTQPEDGVFSPRLKPTADNENAIEFAVVRPAPTSQPMRIGDLMLAGDEIAPAPIFYESDVTRQIVDATPTAIALAGDLDLAPHQEVVEIERGETFVDALRRAGVAAVDRNAAAYAFGEHYNLRQLRPGQKFNLTLTWPNQTLYQLASADAEPEARLLGLEFRADTENNIKLSRSGAVGFAAETKAIALTTRTMAIAGRINGSLYLSAKAEGAPDRIIADLADAFAYDVDFQREIFGGDEFEAIFEAKYDDQGRLVSSGDILYARLKWRGRAKEKGYYRYVESGSDRGDFYDATGQSAKRLLMKTPIDGARLSSGFGTRKHPILGYRRAHKGLDFAANRGTPIKAAGDGIVERADRYGSFGNYIRIRHANGYKTAYAHLNGFARGIRKGKRVDQGDIIGYVGTTGRSTGPHLHYEVHLNGSAVNPQTLKIATGKKLTGSELARFQNARDMIDAMRLMEDTASGLLARDGSTEESAL